MLMLLCYLQGRNSVPTVPDFLLWMFPIDFAAIWSGDSEAGGEQLSPEQEQLFSRDSLRGDKTIMKRGRLLELVLHISTLEPEAASLLL